MSGTPTLRKILFVEDDPDIQVVAQVALVALGGFSVTICGSGREALAAAPSCRPDLVLLDVMMPEMDGPATLRGLRAIPETAEVPVVFMTARVQAREREEYQALGALSVIAKPFDPMTLAADLERIWSARR